MKKQRISIILLQAVAACHAILQEELGKDLPTNYNNHDILARKRRPLGGNAGGAGCNFNGFRGPKGQQNGRTFFDLQFFNVEYQHNYNINCGGGYPSSAGGGHGGQAYKPITETLGGQKPGGLGGHRPGGSGGHKPILGNHGNGGGLFSNKPSKPVLSMILANRPLQGLFSQSQTQTQTGSQSTAISGAAIPTSTPSIVTPAAPDLVTEPTIDPDDIIYNDNIKPVYETTDVVAGSNKLPPGAYFNRYQNQNRYQSLKKYQDQKLSVQANRNKFHYQQNGQAYNQGNSRTRQDVDIFSANEGGYGKFEEERSGSGPRGFRFPT